MQPHALTTFAENLVAEYGTPRVLDVEHSVQVQRPTLTGSHSVASYYIRPPDGMSAETLIGLFGEVPGFERMNLTLISILGLDTYHQPLISADDYAKKYFSDNHQRIIRVVGKSDQAIAAMAAFIDGLRPPFDARAFPHHEEFLVSKHPAPAPGRSAEVWLLFKPADSTLLMKVERLVKIHLEEINMGREIATSRHSTRGHAPELILSATLDSLAGQTYLDGLAKSLPSASEEEVATATEMSNRAANVSTSEPSNIRVSFAQAVVETLPASEVKRRAMAGIAEILRSTRFADGVQIETVQAGTAIEATFPRTAGSLWLSTSFDEGKHIKAISSACIALKADPVLREGWAAHYRFDRKTGKLLVRAADAGAPPSNDFKVVPRSE